ncbi:MAG: MFS transporter [Pseudanabaena sp.]|nr:MAG: MFS transporter [Pseudanabaena sp.]
MKIAIAEKYNSLPTRVTLLVASMLTIMASATIAPSLPAMLQHFESVPNSAYWVRLVLTLPALFIAISAPVLRVLVDRIGRKPLLLLSLIIYGLAGSSGLWLNSLDTIIVGRALLGVSVAGISISTTALIADYYSGAARGKFLGLQAAFSSLGGVVFVSLGGWLADIGWRNPFLIYFAALLVLPAVLYFLSEPSRQDSTQSSDHSSNSEESSRLPYLIVGLTFAAAMLGQMAFYTIPVQIPFYLKNLFQSSASQSGMAIAICTLGSAISAFQYQRIKAKLTFFSIYGIAFSTMALGFGLISLGSSFAIVVVGLGTVGLGLGLVMPNMTFCLTSATAANMRGKILGGLTTSMFLGQFVSPLVSQPLSLAIGLNMTYGVAGIAMVILAIAFVILLWNWHD